MLERLKEIFREVLKVEVDENSTPENTDGWDSLAHIGLIVTIEDEFDVKFTMSEIAQMTSFGKIYEMLGEKKHDCKQHG